MVFHWSVQLPTGVIAMSWCPMDSTYLLTCAKDNRTICWDTISGEVSFFMLIFPWWRVVSFPFFMEIPFLGLFLGFFESALWHMAVSIWIICRLWPNYLLEPTGILMFTGIRKYPESYQHLRLMGKLASITLRLICISWNFSVITDVYCN